jgi:hypothetical protein
MDFPLLPLDPLQLRPKHGSALLELFGVYLLCADELGGADAQRLAVEDGAHAAGRDPDHARRNGPGGFHSARPVGLDDGADVAAHLAH